MISFSFINAIDPTTIVFIVLLVLLIVALLVVPMFTNKKRAKQTEELHSSLHPGDLIKTVGGVIGTIKEIRQVSPVDKEMVIETGTGDNKTTMTFDIMALYQVMSRATTTVHAEDIAQPEEAPAAETVSETEPVAVQEEEPSAPVEDAPVADTPVEEEAAAADAPAEEPAPAPQKKSNTGSKKTKK